MEFDKNINNYTDEELFEILGLHENTSKNMIKIKINEFIETLENLENKNDNDLLIFFNQIKNRLLNNNQKNNGKNNGENNGEIDQTTQWITNQFIPQNNKLENNRITNRNNTVDILNNPNEPVMQRKALGIANSIPLNIGQGTINPNLRQLEKRVILIDSKFRQNILPFSNDPNHISSSTNFFCNLSRPLTNVVKMRLGSIFIPKTFNVYDKFIGNTFFYIKRSGEDKHLIHIPDGNYESEKLKDVINEKLIVNDFSNVKIDFYNENSNIFYFSLIDEGDPNEYTIIFHDEKTNLDTSYCTNNIYYTTNLGYYLGFRYICNDDDDCYNDFPTYWDIKISKNKSSIAQSPVDVIGSQYFSIAIDDFTNNQSSSSLITIREKNDKLSLPAYYNKLSDNQNDPSLNYYTDVDGIIHHQYVPMPNQRLTQNQLFSINSIISNRRKQNNRLYSNNNQHILATINMHEKLLDDNIKSISINNIPDNGIHERVYFGPVVLDRLHISLYDSTGRLVNLNNHNWSFTLFIEQLYQY